jgi:hypothetical protein
MLPAKHNRDARPCSLRRSDKLRLSGKSLSVLKTTARGRLGPDDYRARDLPDMWRH